MKRSLLLFALLLAAMTHYGQTISSDFNQEYCPNTEYTFTVSLPDAYQGISVSGPIITQNPTGFNSNYTTFNFKAKFGDVNQAQTITITYGSSGSVTFSFKRIKSLFYGSCSNIDPSTITAPLCQTTGIPYSFTELQWLTKYENPTLCFGSISTYEYLLPAGWKLNGTPSDGVNWLPGGHSVTFTPDAGTGGGIQVRAINGGCAPASIYKGPSTYLPISRPGPTFSLSPTSVTIQCGTSITQTFTVTMNGTTTCTPTYQWNLGSNNGWLYGGSPAPTTPFTGPASITLTSLATNPNYGNVSVTPLINGAAQGTLTATVAFQAPNLGLVGGDANICTGTSSPYTLYNAPSGSSIFWGTSTVLPNYGATVVHVDNPYASSTTLTKINSGVVNLTVSVTDGCNQTYSRTRQNINVGGYANTSILSGYTLAYPPCHTQGCTPSAVSSSINTAGPAGTIAYSGTAYLNTENYLYLYNSEVSSGTWSLVSGNPWYWSSTSGNQLTVYPGDNNPIVFRLTNNNSCGDLYYDFTFYPTEYYYSGYRLAPNPARGNLTVTLEEEKPTGKKPGKLPVLNIREIIIMDHMGVIRQRQLVNSGTKQLDLDISRLKPGTYFLRLFNGKEWKSLPFIKQ